MKLVAVVVNGEPATGVPVATSLTYSLYLPMFIGAPVVSLFTASQPNVTSQRRGHDWLLGAKPLGVAGVCAEMACPSVEVPAGTYPLSARVVWAGLFLVVLVTQKLTASIM